MKSTATQLRQSEGLLIKGTIIKILQKPHGEELPDRAKVFFLLIYIVRIGKQYT